jgi:hypothetical protein
VAGEADLVANLGLAFIDPCVGRVWQDFAANESLDSAGLR